MSETLSLKEAERRTFQVVFLDGLTELLLGLTFLALSISAILGESVEVPYNYLPLIGFYLVGLPLYFIAKKRITLPRIGLVKYGPARRRKIQGVRLVMIILFVITLAVFLSRFVNKGDAATISGPYWIVDAVFGLFALAIFSYMAYSHEQPRMYLYGLLLGLSMPFDVVLEHTTGWDFPLGLLIFGFVMVILGGVFFSRFLRDYPLPEEGVYNGSNG